MSKFVKDGGDGASLRASDHLLADVRVAFGGFALAAFVADRHIDVDVIGFRGVRD